MMQFRAAERVCTAWSTEIGFSKMKLAPASRSCLRPLDPLTMIRGTELERCVLIILRKCFVPLRSQSTMIASNFDFASLASARPASLSTPTPTRQPPTMHSKTLTPSQPPQTTHDPSLKTPLYLRAPSNRKITKVMGADFSSVRLTHELSGFDTNQS